MAHFLDAWTTHCAVVRGNARELNPLMRPVVNHFGLAGLLGVKAGALGYAWYSTRHLNGVEKEEERFTLFALGMLPVVNNTAEIAAHQSLSMLKPWNPVLPGSTPGVASV